jgi:hypothetical protein
VDQRLRALIFLAARESGADFCQLRLLLHIRCFQAMANLSPEFVNCWSLQVFHTTQATVHRALEKLITTTIIDMEEDLILCGLLGFGAASSVKPTVYASVILQLKSEEAAAEA